MSNSIRFNSALSLWSTFLCYRQIKCTILPLSGATALVFGKPIPHVLITPIPRPKILTKPKMPFRFSEFNKRGKSGNPWTDAVDTVGPSRPESANSYDFRHYSPGPPPLPPVPSHADTRTFAKISYDNGTGYLDPRLIQQKGLPPSIKTTDQLAEYLRRRNQGQKRAPSPGSSSQHSQSTGPPSERLGVPQPLRTRNYAVRGPSGSTTASGHRGRYEASVVARVLPGTTRKHPYEGFWLSRGTVKKPERNLKWRRKVAAVERPATAAGAYVETSGWYN